MADLAVLARGIKITRPKDAAFNGATDTLGRGQPGNMEKQTEAESEQQQQQQGGAGKTQRTLCCAADHLTQHATGRAWHRRFHRIHTHVFDADAAG